MPTLALGCEVSEFPVKSQPFVCLTRTIEVHT
jgi:hypothetical protein